MTRGIPYVLPRGLKLNTCLHSATLLSPSLFGRHYRSSELKRERPCPWAGHIVCHENIRSRETSSQACVPVACEAQHGPLTRSSHPHGGQRAQCSCDFAWSQEHKTGGGVRHLSAKSRNRGLGVSQHQRKLIGYIITASVQSKLFPFLWKRAPIAH